MPVDSDVLRGSGRPLSGTVAAALGVVPGQPRTFLHGDGGLKVTWPVTSAFGPSVGSVRVLASDAGAIEGDRIRLDFDMEQDSVSAERVPQDLDGYEALEAIRLLTGISADLERAREMLADAIDARPANVQRTLVERGDGEVAGLLPKHAVDPQLESRLSDLAQLIHQR